MNMPGMTAEAALDRAGRYGGLGAAAAETSMQVRPAQYAMARAPVGAAGIDCDATCLGSCGLACALGLVPCAACIGLCCIRGSRPPIVV